MPQRSGSKKRQIDVQKQKLKSSNLMTSKKKHGDFPKKQAKPGRHLPVATNFTNTNFKTKQISLPPLKDNEDLKPETLQELFPLLSKNLSGIKEKALEKILIYINSNNETLPGYCSDILKKVSSLLLDNMYGVRQKAIKVILTCCALLTESQCKEFLHLIELSIIPMMTHNVSLINRDSLHLLNGLLNIQPTNICSSTKILYKMLGMISVAYPNKKELSLMDTVDDSITADDWRRNVFMCIKSFLSIILDNHQPVNNDEKIVSWNGEHPLYLPLYRNSGTQLPKISYSWNNEDSYDVTKVLVEFLEKLLPLVGEALKGKFNTSCWKKFDRITGVNFSDENDILLLVEILNIVGQWVEQSKQKRDLETITDLLQQMCKYLMGGFPYEFSSQKSSFQQNLYIIHLYSIFLLDTPLDSPQFQSCIVDHFVNMFVSLHTVPETSMSLILKFSKVFLSSEKFTLDFKNGLLFGLSGILESKRFSKTAEAVCAFFIDLSLDTDFNYLSKTKAMSNWYKSLIVELNFIHMSENMSDASKQFLKYVRQVCAQKQPDFMQVLNQYPPSNLIDLLKYNNEDFQLTIIVLISNINSLSSEFLQELADVIHKKLPLKTSQRLIYNLHSRFSRDAPVLQKLEFIKLLLNIACDTLPIVYHEDVFSDGVDDKLVGVLCEVQNNRKAVFFPSKKWEDHRKIFEPCINCLTSYLKDGIGTHILEFIKDLMVLELNYKLPVHIAIAILEIIHKVGFRDRNYFPMIFNLWYQGLMYSATMADYCFDEEWCAGRAMERALHLDTLNSEFAVAAIIHGLHNETKLAEMNDEYVTRIFRMIAYLIQMGCIRPNESSEMMAILNKLSEYRYRSSLVENHWITIYKMCNFM